MFEKGRTSLSDIGCSGCPSTSASNVKLKDARVMVLEDRRIITVRAVIQTSALSLGTLSQQRKEMIELCHLGG
jgi:hypothetical protein